jgi:hypothetical protein
MPMNARLLRPTPTGFDPRRIAGLQLWLDAADSSTITTSTGVSEWRDKSATKSVWAQAIGNDQPATGTATMNGRNVLVFDGSNDSLSATTPLSTSMPLTMFVVQRIVSIRTFGMTYTSGTSGAHFDIRQDSSTGRLEVVANATQVAGVGATTDRTGNNDILSVRFPDTGTNSVFLNGTALAAGPGVSARPVLTGTHYIGRRSDGFYANLRVAEILAYSTLLTDTQRKTVESYLGKKWGITVA